MRLSPFILLVTACAAPPADDAPLCQRGYDDAVSRALCATPAPLVSDLRALQRAVGFDPDLEGPTTVALTSHSTSLVARVVSPLNPRLVMLKRGVARQKDPDFVVLAFTRGERFAELAARDRRSGELRFFLVRFETAAGVDPFTEAVERGWSNVTVAADDTLGNTPVDCNRCHQPNGPGTPKLLRMQELRFPWTHWLGRQPFNPKGRQLLADFTGIRAPTEQYGGVPVQTIAASVAPEALEGLVEDEGYAAQPNEFDSATIAAELAESGKSATWEAIAREAAEGRALAVPYFALSATDPAKQAAAGAAYAAGAPFDFRTLLTVEAERAMRIRPRENATGREILVQLCGGCHHAKLDPRLSRARFDVGQLDAMSRGEKLLAISRMTLPADNPGLMPPAIEGELTADERVRAIAELER